jgi:hypothetical protein
LYLGAIFIFGVLLFSMIAIGVFSIFGGGKKDEGDAGVRDTTCTSPRYTDIKDETAYAKAIDELIPNNSPLNGLGSSFVSGGKAAGINPALIYAIARKESSFGTAGIATHGTNNSFGRTTTGDQPHVSINGRKWYKWSSWEGSLATDDDTEAAYIKRVYLSKGKDTIQDIMYTYAPPSENDTDGYIDQVYDWIDKLVKKANEISPGAVNCT